MPLLLLLILVPALFAIEAWIIMVLWGAIVGAFELDLTTLSFWPQAMLVAVALGLVGGFFRGGTS